MRIRMYGGVGAAVSNGGGYPISHLVYGIRRGFVGAARSRRNPRPKMRRAQTAMDSSTMGVFAGPFNGEDVKWVIPATDAMIVRDHTKLSGRGG